jgi:hypothetical protein
MHKGKYCYPTVKLLEEFGNRPSSELAELFGVSRDTIHRWAKPDSTINQWDADRYAVKTGRHPGEIWENWFDIGKKDHVGV